MTNTLPQQEKQIFCDLSLHHFTDVIFLVDIHSASCTEYSIEETSGALLFVRKLHYDEWLIEFGRTMLQIDTARFFTDMNLKRLCQHLDASKDGYTTYFRIHNDGNVCEFELKCFYTSPANNVLSICTKKILDPDFRPLASRDALRCLNDRFRFMLEHTVENFIEIQVSTGNCVMEHTDNGMKSFANLKDQIDWWANNFIVPEERERYINEFALNNLLAVLRAQNGYHQCIYNAYRGDSQLSLRIVCTLLRKTWGSQEEIIFAYAQDVTTETEQERRNKQLVDISQQLLNLSQNEPVTGLYNRSAGEKFIEEYLASSGNTGTLLLIDIDNFKNFNDSFGHQTGDFVLKFLGKSLQDVFRSDDILCRWGGDEFIVFMRNICQKQHVESRVERLRARMRLCKQAEHPLEVTVSIGGAISKCRTNLKELFVRCDRQLYLVKERGRDSFLIDEL